MTAHDHSVPTPELPENWDAMDNHAKECWLERQLTDRSKAIKTILKKEAGTQQGAWELRIAIGHQLEAARRLLPSDRAYGSWFKDQRYRCHPRWGRVLRTAARNEELVRGLHESQLPGGRPNFEQLVKLADERPDLAQAVIDGTPLRDAVHEMKLDEEKADSSQRKHLNATLKAVQLLADDGVRATPEHLVNGVTDGDRLGKLARQAREWLELVDELTTDRS